MTNDHVTGDNTIVSSLTPVVGQCQSLNVQYPCSGPVSLSPTVAAQLSAVRCGHLNPPSPPPSNRHSAALTIFGGNTRHTAAH